MQAEPLSLSFNFSSKLARVFSKTLTRRTCSFVAVTVEGGLVVGLNAGFVADVASVDNASGVWSVEVGSGVYWCRCWKVRPFYT